MQAVFEVIQAGLFTSFQDMGRPGHLSWGISHCGVMDKRLAATANRKLGNNIDAPLIEFAHIPPKLRTLTSTTIAIESVDCVIMVDGKVSSSPLNINKGQLISIHPKAGVYGYIAICGGFQAKVAYGSVSYHQLTKIGGGRLEKGQIIQSKQNNISKNTATRTASIKLPDYHKKSIACYPGIELSSFEEKKIKSFLKKEHTISPSSNRMGIVLNNEKPFSHTTSIISSPVLPGTLQLPPEGHIIVLGQDGQSIGGYPRIGTVSKEDMAVLAQKKPGEKIRFQIVTW